MSQPACSLSDLEGHHWESANILRGPVDAADFKTYIFPLLFFKRIRRHRQVWPITVQCRVLRVSVAARGQAAGPDADAQARHPGKGKRRFRVTTDSNHDLPIAPHLLNREFAVAEPDKVWAGDMT